MRKYFYYAFLALQNLVEYRINIFWKFSGLTVRTLMLYFFWVAVLGTGFGQSNYNATSLAAYYIAITFVGNFSGFDYHNVADDIRTGDLSTILIRPANYFLILFFGSLPDRILTMLIYLVLYLALFGKEIGSLSLFSLPGIIAVLIVSLLMNFFVGITIGALAFWFRRVHGFEALFWNLGGLFSGQLIPVDLLPAKLLVIANYLPFKYMVFFPAQVILGKPINNLWQNVLIQAVWVFVFFLTMVIIWKKGIFKFEASGQ
ncbi:ABC-2 family transporter protein [Candidatus Microgenomates bacterium]|nr:ABC-2 family transporter protein [Candidatus Microgenomates bacterium]